MDVLRQFIVESLVEGKLENETTVISRQLVQRIRNNIERHGGMKRGFTIEIKKTPVHLNLVWMKAKVAIDTSINRPHITGEYIYDDFDGTKYGAVTLKIDVPPSWKDIAAAKQQYSLLVKGIKNVLRHELEHNRAMRMQTTRKTRRKRKATSAKDAPFYDMPSLRRYMMYPDEIEAYVAGMYKEAKMMKRPLKDVFDDKMRQVVKAALAFKADKEKEILPLVHDLFSAWREYAKKRFPKAKI